MSAFTTKDLFAPITNRIKLLCMRIHSVLLDQGAVVERLKAWQHEAASEYHENHNQPNKAKIEKRFGIDCRNKANEFETRAMFIRADMRYYR